MRVLTVLTVSGLGLVDAGCRSCPAILYVSSLTVEFERGIWAPGIWQIDLAGYSEGTLCVVTLPYQPGDVVACGEDLSVLFHEDGSIDRVSSRFMPGSFTLSLMHDGEPMFAEFVEPVYRTTHSGPCGGGRTGRVSVPFPATS